MSELVQILGGQIAAARALLNMSQPELANASRISIPTLRRMEAQKEIKLNKQGEPTLPSNNELAVRRALENAGVIFLPQNGEGVGVRLKTPD